MTDESSPRTSLSGRSRLALALTALAVVAMFLVPAGAVAISSSSPVPHALSAAVGPAVAGVPVAPAVTPARTITISLPSASSAIPRPTTITIPELHALKPAATPADALKMLDTTLATPRSLGHVTPGTSGSENVYVDSSVCGTDSGLAQVGSNPDDLVQGVSSLFGFYNGSFGANASVIPAGLSWYPPYTNATPCGWGQTNPLGNPADTYSESNFTLGNGSVEVARSINDGQSWTDSWLTLNKTWLPVNISKLGGTLDNLIADAANVTMPYGQGEFASNAAGTLLMYAVPIQGTCNILYFDLEAPYGDGANGIPCGGQALLNTTSGIAVATSTDGGASWAVPHQIYNTTTWTTCDAGAFVQYNNITENPSIAMNPSNGDAVVEWDNVELAVNQSVGTANTCASTVVRILTYRSVSTDGGIVWSAPKLIFSGNSQYGGELPGLAVGPAPSYTMYSVATNYGNFSTTGPAIQITHSTTNGASWSVPSLVSVLHPSLSAGCTPPGSALQECEISPGSSPVAIAVDNWSASPYKGDVYVAWTDNLSGTNNVGYPGIIVDHSSNGGTSFTNDTIYNASEAWTYWSPTLSVAPDGDLWLTFLAVNSGDGSLRMLGAVSNDGGTSFGPVFPIANTTAPFATADPVPGNVGVRNGLVASSLGAVASWTDARLANVTTAFDLNVYDTTLLTGNLNTSVANATLTGSLYGLNLRASASYLAETPIGWAVGSTQSFTAPLTVPIPGSGTDIGAFQDWSGAASATTATVSFNPSSGGTLTANYQEVAAAVIAGTIVLSQQAVANAGITKVTIDGSAVTLSPDGSNAAALQFSTPVSGTGDHVVIGSAIGSATGYYATYDNASVPATSGQTTTISIVLDRTNGTITGRLSVPAGTSYAQTTVLLNGTTTVPVNQTTGLIDFSTVWGTYTITATNLVTTNYSQQIQVIPNTQTPLNPNPSLSGGWIAGNIQPATLTQAGGLTVTVTGTGGAVVYQGASYNVSRVSGVYMVTIAATGYTAVSKQVDVVAGQTTAYSATLSNTAYVVGTIGPASALVNASLDKLTISLINISKGVSNTVAFNKTSGLFNASVHAGWNYNLQASESGYKTVTFVVKALAAGTASSPFTITMNLTTSTQNCTVLGTCPPHKGGGGNTSSSGIPLTLILAAVGVLALVAIVAAVLLMRRRGGSGGGDMGDDSSGTTGEAAAPPPEWSEPESPGQQ